MSPETIATLKLDTKTDQVFFPQVDYEPILSLEESWGGKARRLWEKTFSESAELATDSALLYTGIGAAPEENLRVPVRRFGDGTQVPLYVDLEKELGRVPRVLFLAASAFSAENVLGLRALARNYKDQGVTKIIAILTSFAQERQDHRFYDESGSPIPQPTMLKDAIDDLALKHYIDGGILIQPHSLRPVELAFREGFPLLPVDAFNFLIKRARLDQVINPFVMGPDKGRKDEARILASQLGCPMASATKSRDRLGNGDPVMIIPPEALAYIKQNNCHVIVADDEIREAGTTGGLATALDGFANGMTVVAIKGIFAPVSPNLNGDQISTNTAVARLLRPLVWRIVITDGVQPRMDTSPLKDKLEKVRLGRELEQIVAFLQRSLVDPANPSWLRDPKQTGTLLRLDLSVEQFE